MKILIASDLHYPVINGVATFSRNLALGLAERGHEVVVIAPSQNGKKSVEKDGKVTVYRTRSTIFPFYQNIRISLTPRMEVKKIIQDFQPDVIHIQMLMWIGQAAMAIGRRYDIPIISTSHAMADNLLDNLKRLSVFSKPIAYMLNDYGRRFHSRADIITSPTQSALNGFGKHIEKVTKPIRIISNGIDLRMYSPGKTPDSIYDTYGIPKNKRIMTYLGRVDAEKHIWVFVRAVKLITEKMDGVHAIVVGHGVDRENLELLAHEIGVHDHITFTGRVSDEDKVELHRMGEVYCMPSPVELQCIAALEAMASGQPVVAVDAGALGELCHDGENGYRFALDDYEQAAEGMMKILNDKKLRDKFSKESIRIANSHDLENTLDQYYALYEDVIKDKKEELAKRPKSLVKEILG